MDVGIIWVLDPITNINNNINISRSFYYQSLTRYPEIWATTWVHFGIWGTCYYLDHNHIGAICNAKYDDIVGLLPRTMSGSMVLLQPEFVLMPVFYVANKGYIDSQNLSLHQYVTFLMSMSVLLLSSYRPE